MTKLSTPLPTNLPENWTYGQIIAPTGQEVGLPANYGYNYLMNQVNNAQKAALELERKKAELDMGNLESPSTALYNLGAKPSENLLDNWYFVGGGKDGQFPINQRGQEKYAIPYGYTFDRWNNSSQTEHVFLQTNGVYTEGGIRQIHEDWQEASWAGKTMTASVLLESGLSTFTFTYPDSTNRAGVGSSDGVIVIGRVQNYGWNKPTFGIFPDETKIIAAKLEFGAKQTLARRTATSWQLLEIPDYTVELAKCQQYFERIHLPVGVPMIRCKTNLLKFTTEMVQEKRLDAPTITPQEMYVTRFSDNAGVYGAFVKKEPTCSSVGRCIIVSFEDEWVNVVNAGDAAYLGGKSYIDISAEL